MPFQKFNSTNNANCLLDAPITESSNTLNLKGTFGRFPTANFIVCVTEIDVEGEAIFRENMLISTRSGNVCNIQTRKYEAVPQTDDSLTNVAESYAFSSDSEVEVVVSSAFVKDIQDEVTRLESDKLNKGGLRTALANAWRMFISNGSNNETELSLGTSGTYLKSTGAGSAPVWDNPPLDINGQTTDNSDVTSSDFLAWFRDGTGVRKRIALASESIVGLVKKATFAESYAGTDDIKYITSVHLRDNAGIKPGNTTVATLDSGFISGINVQTYTGTSLGSMKVDYTYTTGSGTNRFAVGLGKHTRFDNGASLDFQYGSFLEYVALPSSSSGSGTFYIPSFLLVPTSFVVYGSSSVRVIFTVKKV